jgi:hypothetical protein
MHLRGSILRNSWYWAAFGCCLLAGCTRPQPLAIVEGVLKLNGKPLGNCLVTFLPDPARNTVGSYSSGTSDEQGRFRLAYQVQREGAVPGWHRVLIQDLSTSTGVVRRDRGEVDAALPESTAAARPRLSRVPRRYTDPGQTPLQVEVLADEQPQQVSLEIRSGAP